MRGIHRWPVDSPHKGPVMQKALPRHDVIMSISLRILMAASRVLWIINRSKPPKDNWYGVILCNELTSLGHSVLSPWWNKPAMCNEITRARFRIKIMFADTWNMAVEIWPSYDLPTMSFPQLDFLYDKTAPLWWNRSQFSFHPFRPWTHFTKG